MLYSLIAFLLLTLESYGHMVLAESEYNMHTLTIAGIIGGVATGFMLAGAAERISEAVPQSMAAAPTRIEVEQDDRLPDIHAILDAMRLPVTTTEIGTPPHVAPPVPRAKPQVDEIALLIGGL